MVPRWFDLTFKKRVLAYNSASPFLCKSLFKVNPSQREDRRPHLCREDANSKPPEELRQRQSYQIILYSCQFHFLIVSSSRSSSPLTRRHCWEELQTATGAAPPSSIFKSASSTVSSIGLNFFVSTDKKITRRFRALLVCCAVVNENHKSSLPCRRRQRCYLT